MESTNNNITVQPNHWLRTFRVLVLPVLFFWPFYFTSSFLITLALPTAFINCRGFILSCNQTLDVELWQIGFVLQSIYSLLAILIIAPSRRSFLMVIGLTLIFGLIDYQIVNGITVETAQSITNRRFLIAVIELALFAVFSLAVTMGAEGRRHMLRVGIGLLCILVMMLFGLEVSNLSQNPTLSILLLIFASFCWSGFAALRERLGGH